jgi:ATP-dependent Clp protease ATP-binding subunit ClpB
MKGIVEIQLGRLRELLEERRIGLELTDAARTWLANTGYDPVYGARPLKRVIQRQLQDPLALRILEGRIGEGGTAHIDVADGGLAIDGDRVALAA